MLLQLVAAAATIIGLLSTWLLGRRRNSGWVLGICCCLIWCGVNVQLHMWGGIAQAVIGAWLAARNWQHWRHGHNQTP